MMVSYKNYTTWEVVQWMDSMGKFYGAALIIMTSDGQSICRWMCLRPVEFQNQMIGHFFTSVYFGQKFFTCSKVPTMNILSHLTCVKGQFCMWTLRLLLPARYIPFRLYCLYFRILQKSIIKKQKRMLQKSKDFFRCLLNGIWDCYMTILKPVSCLVHKNTQDAINNLWWWEKVVKFTIYTFSFLIV